MIATTKLLSRAAAIAAGDHITAFAKALNAFRDAYHLALYRARAARGSTLPH